ncbi:MAG: hypothetical protein JJE39_03635 [Vicinamibacteria bacterium]|nr:hypothetical protein [Vicinamibacteria bacterium]
MTPRLRLRTLTRLTLAGALFAFGAAVAVAESTSQPAQPKTTQRDKTPGTRSGPDRPVGHVPELRSETFRLMDAYVISNLQESIGLSEEQFAKVLPLVKKLQSDRREFAMKRMSALRSLRRTLQSGMATEAGVGEILKDVKSAVADERAATVSNLDALDAVLTPLQQAKYRVFEAEVDTRLRHLLARTQDRERPARR